MKNKILLISSFFIVISFAILTNLDTVTAESVISDNNSDYSYVKVKPIYLNPSVGIPTIDSIFGQNILDDKLGNNIPISNIELDNVDFSKSGVYITNVTYYVNEKSFETEVPVIILDQNSYIIPKPIYLNLSTGTPTIDNIFGQNILDDKSGNNTPISGIELDNVDFSKSGIYITKVIYYVNEESFEREVPVIITNYL